MLINFFKSLYKIVRSRINPIEPIMYKTKFFLKHQISFIEDNYKENKYSVITIESLAYTVAIAENLGKRVILLDETIPLLVYVFGDDYIPRFTQLFATKQEHYDPGYFRPVIKQYKSLAMDDVRGGMISCSNFLVQNARSSDLGISLKIDASKFL